MFNACLFRDVVSGRRRDGVAHVTRGALRLAEVPYTWAVRFRNHRYDTGGAPIERVSVPVISVGNITLGGTGKTPFVAWLARWFREHGVRVGLVSRGYGARPGEANDEALELESALPDVPHAQDADRVRGARLAIEEFASQLLILDDGFQHRRLARDLDIVLLDAQEPTGFDHVFPRGTLREPLGGLRRAHVVALSRADAISEAERQRIAALVRRIAPAADWVELAHRPAGLQSASGSTLLLDALRGHRVAAFCGLGNPEGFRHTLGTLGVELVEFRAYPDHFPYRRSDVEELAVWLAKHDVAAALCTRKDQVKLQVDLLGRVPLWAVTIGIDLLTGRESLETRLRPLVPRSE